MKKIMVMILTGILLNSPAFSQKKKKEMMRVKGTLTDSLGRFEIMAPQGDMLTFNANGFEQNRRKVQKENDPLVVNMILEYGDKNQESVVAYGHIRKEDLTHALAHYSDLNSDFAKYTPMVDYSKVFLRGSESTGIGGFDHSALFVLDGVPTDRVDHLNPKDVKTITLLKGSEANLYGSRGSHGAVLIETK